MKFHCIGDSHVSFFSGYNQLLPLYPSKGKGKYSDFVGYRIGAVLAYSLVKENSSQRGREKIFELLGSFEKDEIIIFLFGEIDIRCHLLKQTNNSTKNLSNVIDECVNRYVEFLIQIRELGYSVIVMAPVPTSNNYDPEYPYFGNMIERNNCTNLFNEDLKNKSKIFNIPYFCINQFLIKKNLYTRSEFFFDALHLSTLTIPLVKLQLYKIGFYKKGILNYNIILFDVYISLIISKLKKINRIIRKRIKLTND